MSCDSHSCTYELRSGNKPSNCSGAKSSDARERLESDADAGEGADGVAARFGGALVLFETDLIEMLANWDLFLAIKRCSEMARGCAQ